MAPLPVLNMHRGKGYLNVLPFHPAPWCLAKRHQQELTLYHYMDQSFCFRALSSGAKAIAAAAAKWVLGLKSEFARPAPVTVDPFHIHLKKEESSSESIWESCERNKLKNK